MSRSLFCGASARLVLVCAFLVSLTLLCARPAAAQRRAEPPTLERTIELARVRAIVVAEAEGELGVAHAQMTGARVSSLGNPYMEIQIDKGLTQNAGQELQAIAYTYFPVDIGGQRGARIDEATRLVKWREIGVSDARGIAVGE